MRRYLGLDVHQHDIHGYWFHPGHKGAHGRFPNTPEGGSRGWLTSRPTRPSPSRPPAMRFNSMISW